MRPFLTARWSHLFLATYPVPPSLLQKRTPAGLQLDTIAGQAFVSLVAFEFLNMAPHWPLAHGLVPKTAFGNFVELNLRFYVRHGEERGVVFVREFVPSRLVAWVARVLYNEPYLAAPLCRTRHEEADHVTMEYRLRWAGREHSLTITGGKPAFVPSEACQEHFFKEHHWGYGQTRRGHTIRYQVDHPVWAIYPVQSYQIDLDWAKVYGPEWDFLGGTEPCSVIFAVGSNISVYPKGIVRVGSRTQGLSEAAAAKRDG